MSLYKRGGIWWSRIERDGQVFQESTKCANKNDARQVEAVWLADMAKGAAGIFKPPTLSGFTEKFLNYLPDKVKGNTYTYYVDSWGWLVHRDSPLCNVRLNQINALKVQEYVQFRKTTPYTRGEKGTERFVTPLTINHDLAALRRALHLAREWKIIPIVPRIESLRVSGGREAVIDEPTLARFLELCDSTEADEVLGGRRFHAEMKLVLPFLIDTGLRREELCNLNWSDVTLGERSSILVRDGKTKNARRVIPLTQRALTILNAIRPNDHNNELPVFTRNGVRVKKDWMTHQFTAMRRKLGLPDGMVLHSTRHTFCSRLGWKGVSPYVLQKLAGHATITISAKYTHTNAKQLDAAVSLLDSP